MSVIIRLQNLPWSANALDIRQYFRGLSIPEGGVHIVGGEQGDAFIAFSTDEDARQAMAMDGGKIKEVKIKLLLSSRTEMQKVIELARQQTLSLQSFMQAPPVPVPIQPPLMQTMPSIPGQLVPAVAPIANVGHSAMMPMDPMGTAAPAPTRPPVNKPPVPDQKDARDGNHEKKDSDRVKDRSERSHSRDTDKRDRRDRDRNRDRDRYRDRDRDRRRRGDRSRSRSHSRDRERGNSRRRDRSRSRERSRDKDKDKVARGPKDKRDAGQQEQASDQNDVVMVHYQPPPAAAQQNTPSPQARVPQPNLPAPAAESAQQKPLQLPQQPQLQPPQLQQPHLQQPQMQPPQLQQPHLQPPQLQHPQMHPLFPHHLQQPPFLQPPHLQPPHMQPQHLQQPHLQPHMQHPHPQQVYPQQPHLQPQLMRQADIPNGNMGDMAMGTTGMGGWNPMGFNAPNKDMHPGFPGNRPGQVPTTMPQQRDFDPSHRGPGPFQPDTKTPGPALPGMPPGREPMPNQFGGDRFFRNEPFPGSVPSDGPRDVPPREQHGASGWPPQRQNELQRYPRQENFQPEDDEMELEDMEDPFADEHDEYENDPFADDKEDESSQSFGQGFRGGGNSRFHDRNSGYPPTRGRFPGQDRFGPGRMGGGLQDRPQVGDRMRGRDADKPGGGPDRFEPNRMGGGQERRPGAERGQGPLQARMGPTFPGQQDRPPLLERPTLIPQDRQAPAKASTGYPDRNTMSQRREPEKFHPSDKDADDRRGSYQDRRSFRNDRREPDYQRGGDRYRDHEGDLRRGGRFSDRGSRSRGGGFNERPGRGDHRDRFSERRERVSKWSDAKSTGNCVLMRNVPLQCGYKDVRGLFPGLHISNSGIKFINDNEGNRTGIAYIRFVKTEDKEYALQKNGQTIDNKIIVIEDVDDGEFDKAVDSYYPSNDDKKESDKRRQEESRNKDNKREKFQDMKDKRDKTSEKDKRDKTHMFQDNRKDKVPDTKGIKDQGFVCLYLQSLPHYMKAQDVMKFFQNFTVVDVVMETEKGGAVKAFVQFSTHEDAKKALATHSNLTIGHKTISLSLCALEKMEETKKNVGGVIVLDVKNEKIAPAEPVKNALPINATPKVTPSKPAPKESLLGPIKTGPAFGKPSEPVNKTPPSANKASAPINKAAPPVNNVPLIANKAAPNKPLHDPRAGNAQAQVIPQPQELMIVKTDCVLLQGLPQSANDRDILDFFSDVGLVPLRIHIMLDKFGKPSGDAFCEFSNFEETARAANKHNNPMGKQSISVKLVPRGEMLEALGIPEIPEHQEADMPEQHMMMKPPRQGLLGHGPGIVPLLNVDASNSPKSRPPPLLGQRIMHPRLDNRPSRRPGRHEPFPDMQELQELPVVEGFGKPGCVVAMENVPYKAGIEDILTFFCDFKVARENVIRRYNELGMPTGDARVAFDHPAEAQRAIHELRGSKIRDRLIYLSIV